MAAYGGTGDDLFVGAIMGSPFLPTLRTIEETEWLFDVYSSNVGCGDTSTDQMACLRGLTIEQIQSNDHTTNFPGQTAIADWTWLPVVDGNFSTDLLYNVFDQGKFKHVPTLSKQNSPRAYP